MSTDHPPLIALIHGVPAAIEPAAIAVQEELPDARIWNLLDDRLIEEVNLHGVVTPALHARMERLIDHAVREGADGILITCSLYSFVGATATSAARPVPVLGADSAAFRDVISAQPKRVLLVASVQAALEDSQARLSEAAGEHGVQLEVVPVLVDGALEAVSERDTGRLIELIAATVIPIQRDGDALLLAQYSLSPAVRNVASLLGLAVYSGPARAARELHAALECTRRNGAEFGAE